MSTRMAAEIAEQPASLRRTLDALLPLRPALAAAYDGRRRVLFAARGTSDNAAIYGRYLLEAHAGVSGGLLSPSIATHYRTPLDLSDALVVSVSQSGATTEIVATQEWARACGAATVAVANVAGSPLVEAAGVDAAVAALQDTAYVVVTGRGLMMSTALETALKLEETCKRPVRGYSYADFRHGPISVVAEGMTAVLVAAPDGPLLAPMNELAADVAGRGGHVLGIGGDEGFAAACDVHVPGPALPEALAPLGAIVPPQLIIERLARALGLDPDAPSGLAKVTTTDRI